MHKMWWTYFTLALSLFLHPCKSQGLSIDEGGSATLVLNENVNSELDCYAREADAIEFGPANHSLRSNLRMYYEEEMEDYLPKSQVDAKEIRLKFNFKKLQRQKRNVTVAHISQLLSGAYICTAYSFRDGKNLTVTRTFNVITNAPKNGPTADGGSNTTNKVIGGVSVTIAVVTLLLVWIFYEFFGSGNNGLTKEEIQEFLLGNAEAIRNGAYAHENASYMPYRNNYEIPQDNLYVNRQKFLGGGQYGAVFLGRYNGNSVAVKTVKPFADKMYLKALLAELKIMIYLGHHSNIVSLLGASTSNLASGRVYVVVDFCELGSLYDYLKAHKQNFISQMDEFGNVNRLSKTGNSMTSPETVTTKDVVLWSSQMAKAMGFLESKKVIHGDLAARNVLLFDKGTAKVTDFGLSRQLYDYTPNYVKKNMEPLPWRWMAYESLRELTFSSASDVWALGVTLWEIFTLSDVPFAGLSWTNEFVDSLANGFKLSKPTHMTHDMYCQLLKCWSLEPDKRPKFLELEAYLDNALVSLSSLLGHADTDQYAIAFENRVDVEQ